MPAGSDGVAIRIAVRLLLQIIFVEIAAKADKGVSPLAQKIHIARVLIIPAEQRYIERSIHGLLPIIIVEHPNAQSPHREQQATARLILHGRMHNAHFLLSPALAFGNQ